VLEPEHNDFHSKHLSNFRAAPKPIQIEKFETSQAAPDDVTAPPDA
jgi:hypothetical protein